MRFKIGFNPSIRLNITEMNCEMTVTVRDCTIPAFTISICVVSDSHHGLVLFFFEQGYYTYLYWRKSFEF